MAKRLEKTIIIIKRQEAMLKYEICLPYQYELHYGRIFKWLLMDFINGEGRHSVNPAALNLVPAICPRLRLQPQLLFSAF